MACTQQRIWAYESNWGSFAEYCKVQAQQLLHKPPRLSWEEAASYGLTYFTAYRMLVDRAQNPRRRQRPRLGGRRWAGHVCRAALPALRGERDRGGVQRRQDRPGAQAGRARGGRPAAVRPAGSGHRRAQLRRDQALRQGGARGDRRRRLRCRLRARGRGDLLHQRLRLQDLRQDRHLRRDIGLRARLRRPLPVDAPEDDPGQPLRERLRVRTRQPVDCRGQDRPRAVTGVRVVAVPGAAPDDEGEPARGEDGGAGRRRSRGPGRSA